MFHNPNTSRQVQLLGTSTIPVRSDIRIETVHLDQVKLSILLFLIQKLGPRTRLGVPQRPENFGWQSKHQNT